MKKLYITIFIAFLCFLMPQISKADTLEIAGAEMTYKWISGNKYEVSLNIYAECNKTNLDSVWIKVSSPDSNFKPYQKLAKIENMEKLRGTCIANSTCEDPNNTAPGFRKWTATATFNLNTGSFCE